VKKNKMLDYQLIFFLIFFMLWLYFLDYSFIRKEKGFSYLQFGIMIPLAIYISANSYIQSFIFGHLFTFIICVTSIYALAVNMLDLKSEK